MKGQQYDRKLRAKISFANMSHVHNIVLVMLGWLMLYSWMEGNSVAWFSLGLVATVNFYYHYINFTEAVKIELEGTKLL